MDVQRLALNLERRLLAGVAAPAFVSDIIVNHRPPLFF